MGLRAFVFPGQGSQQVGMATSFMGHPDTALLFAEARDALGFDLPALMRDGPAEELTLTENTQPALLLAGIAAMTLFLKETSSNVMAQASFVGGHSLGEYTALVAAGSLSLSDGLRLVRLRGQAMQKAVPVGQGAMVAVLGLDAGDVMSMATANGVYVANDNSPGQIVVSGDALKMATFIEAAKAAGAKRVLPLPVSAPFHCPLMAPAAEVMAQALADVSMSAPVVPVVCNVTAKAETNPDALKQNLIAQVAGSVRWRESMMYMAEEGVTELLEFGSGKVLSGLAARCDTRLTASAITTVDEVSAQIARIRAA